VNIDEPYANWTGGYAVVSDLLAIWHHETMAEHTEGETTQDSRMGKAVVRGVAIGFPVSLIGLTLAIWLITDLDIFDSFATALLPGILLGGFAGGFAGVASTMD